MKRVIAVIEKASDGGYGIHCPDLTGVALYGYGITEDEAKASLGENLESILEYYEEEDKAIPDILNNGEVDFEFRYDFSGFFKSYPFFNVSKLATIIGINPSLMRKYKNGLAFASRDQRKKIESGLHAISKNLSAVQF